MLGYYTLVGHSKIWWIRGCSINLHSKPRYIGFVRRGIILQKQSTFGLLYVSSQQIFFLHGGLWTVILVIFLLPWSKFLIKILITLSQHSVNSHRVPFIFFSKRIRVFYAWSYQLIFFIYVNPIFERCSTSRVVLFWHYGCEIFLHWSRL